MHLHTEHRFAAPVGALFSAMVDPEFHRTLQIPDLSVPEVLGHADDGERASITLRYEFVGHLDPIVLSLLGGEQLFWVQSVEVDRSSGTGSLAFSAESDPGMLHGSGEFSTREDDGWTLRVLDGELVVRIPLFGGAAELRLGPGILSRLDVEADALAARLAT
jgi:Protein of unknown function (DUF2505)